MSEMKQTNCMKCGVILHPLERAFEVASNPPSFMCFGCWNEANMRYQPDGGRSKFDKDAWDEYCRMQCEQFAKQDEEWRIQKEQRENQPTTGLQTPIDESYTAIPPIALAKVATVMASGTRKYGPRNWDRISVSDHLDHAIRHGYLYVMGDTTDEPTGVDHLAHMACRALMALEVEMIRQKEATKEGESK